MKASSEAEALFLKRVADFRRDDPVTNCLPSGPVEMIGNTYRIIQSPTIVAVLYEGGMGRYRQIGCVATESMRGLVG
jgi:hypothetical protein